MKRELLLSSFAAFALTTMASGAMARDGDMPPPPAGRPMMDFSAMDTNGDGKVTKDEIDAQAAKRFSEADTNGDGSVSADEMVAHMEAMAEQRRQAREKAMAESMIKRMDKNGDGVLSADEMKPAGDGSKMFDRLDTDKDGAISEQEFAKVQDRMDKRGKDHGRMGPGMKRHGDRGGDHQGYRDGYRDGFHDGDHDADHMGDGDHRQHRRMFDADRDNG